MSKKHTSFHLTAITVMLTIAIAVFSACASNPEQSPASSAPQDERLWEDVISLYHAFYKENLAENENIYWLSTLDLNTDGTPELIVYMAGSPITSAAAVFTVENGEVCCFTELQNSILADIDVPSSENAVPDLFCAECLSSEPDPESLIVKNGAAFLAFTNHDGGERVFFLHSIAGNQTVETGTWYRFSTDEGKLCVSEMMQHEQYFKGYSDDSKVGKCFINGTEVTSDEYGAEINDFYSELLNEFSLDKALDYAGCYSDAANWESLLP